MIKSYHLLKKLNFMTFQSPLHINADEKGIKTGYFLVDFFSRLKISNFRGFFKI